ncbi:DUF742 domain-containing protein [Actinophytocola sp.]|uniref:DUF742 domain-containing protein n=1 Tax=Actinophytocola sp. TaxID=1872138 RepID=UPI002ED10CBC
MSGVLPIDQPPPTPRALPIGPRSVVPASLRSLTNREKKPKKQLPLAPPPTPGPVSPLADAGPWTKPKEQPPLSVEASNPRQLVRPYTRTGGRTHVGYRLELETLLSTAPDRDRDIATLRDDYQVICEMCRTPQSVAEVAVRLRLPLGAARVLIADVVEAEILSVHETAAAAGPSMDLLARVAAGLKNL